MSCTCKKEGAPEGHVWVDPNCQRHAPILPDNQCPMFPRCGCDYFELMQCHGQSMGAARGDK